MAKYIKLNNMFEINQNILPDNDVFGIFRKNKNTLTLQVLIQDKKGILLHSDEEIVNINENGIEYLFKRFNNDNNYLIVQEGYDENKPTINKIINKMLSNYTQSYNNIINKWELE